jgi:hypothetical protein
MRIPARETRPLLQEGSFGEQRKYEWVFSPAADTLDGSQLSALQFRRVSIRGAGVSRSSLCVARPAADSLRQLLAALLLVSQGGRGMKIERYSPESFATAPAPPEKTMLRVPWGSPSYTSNDLLFSLMGNHAWRLVNYQTVAHNAEEVLD